MTEEIAILAGGCFWGMEDLIRKLPGVAATKVGYTGGALDHPDYKQVKTGKTGHAEAIRIAYDPARTSYRALLEFFFQIHDPSTIDRQGNDIGSQYRSAIFYLNADQKAEAEKIIAEIDASRRWPGKVATQVVPAGKWWDAEEYHQDYLEKYPEGYTCHFIRPEWKVK
ncbi:MAG: peptide-methionine (S)-S-oxide reductase [Alphaproteobacteria bacterium RIFCSPHIGHO2_12_FULL_63_12]|nr:MAG: peptide-methionine (S)-S-oxide reductase [Alphaproteobacteria bacterium RIFCSPHIGHO2_12_FULL_63_12]